MSGFSSAQGLCFHYGSNANNYCVSSGHLGMHCQIDDTIAGSWAAHHPQLS